MITSFIIHDRGPHYCTFAGPPAGVFDVALSHTERLAATIYLPFPGFDQKCFIGCMMNVRWGHIARRSEKPQHAKGVSRLFRTYQNVCFLAKRPYDTTVVEFHRVGSNILFHRLTKAHPAVAPGVLLALLPEPGRSNGRGAEHLQQGSWLAPEADEAQVEVAGGCASRSS
jgi:hypothetical protein